MTSTIESSTSEKPCVDFIFFAPKMDGMTLQYLSINALSYTSALYLRISKEWLLADAFLRVVFKEMVSEAWPYS